MARETCRLPRCERPTGLQDRDDYRSGKFCSVQHEVKYEHIRQDAEDARRDEKDDR